MEQQIDCQEEVEQLQAWNQALKENNDLKREALDRQEKLISLQQETIGKYEQIISGQEELIRVKGQLIAALQREVTLLNQKLEAMQDSVDADGNDDQALSASVRFPRPTKKSLLKKNRRRHG